MSQPSPRHQLVLGLVLATLGSLFLLDNFLILDVQRILPFWPLLLVGLGVIKVAQSPRGDGLWVGGALIAVGCVLTLKHLGWLQFEVRQLWPVALIAAGLAVIFKSRVQPGPAPLDRSAVPGQGARIQAWAVLSGHQSRVNALDFVGGDVNVVMGGAEIDLRDASIQGLATLKVFVLMGGLELRVPPDWTVIVNGLPLLGGIDNRTVPPASPGKRLVIDGICAMGGVEVRN
jgi:hypothetical protein